MASWPRTSERGLTKTIIVAEDGYIHATASTWNDTRGASSGTEVNATPVIVRTIKNNGTYTNSRAFFEYGLTQLDSFQKLHRVFVFMYFDSNAVDVNFVRGTQGSSLEGADYDAITTEVVGEVASGNTGWQSFELGKQQVRDLEILAQAGEPYTIVAITRNDYLNSAPSDTSKVAEIVSSAAARRSYLLVDTHKDRITETNSEVKQDFSMQHFTENAMSDQFVRNVDQIPFSYGVKTPFILNQRNNAAYKNSSRSNTYKVTKTTN